MYLTHTHKSSLLPKLQQQTHKRSKNRLENCLSFCDKSPEKDINFKSFTKMKIPDKTDIYYPSIEKKLANMQVLKTTHVVNRTTEESFTASLFSHCDIRRHPSCRPALPLLYSSISSLLYSVLYSFFYIIFLLLLLQKNVICSPSSSLSVSDNVIASLNSSNDLSASTATELPPPFTFSHHHHRSHLHLSKLFFPLATSSFPVESLFKSSSTTSQPKQSNFLRDSQSLALNDSSMERVMAHRTPVSRKRKRELFALTISETEPLKTLRPGNAAFWGTGGSGGGGTGSRRRRVSAFHGGPAGAHGGKVLLKPPYSVLNPLSSFSSSSSAALAAASAANAAAAAAAAAAAGNMRMKIMLNPPPGFGTGLVPDQKCNFEVYPSGCFDENGSICDNSGNSNLCVCRPGYSIRIASVYCLRPASIGEACYTTEQCERKVQYSGCFSYREEYREENPSAFFGPSQSSWPMGECRCRIGHRYDELSKSCVRSLIGSWCSNVWDCQMVEEGDGAPNGIEGGPGEVQMSSLRQSSSSSHGGSNHSNRAMAHLGLPVQMLPWHSGPSLHGLHGTRAKMANIVCESNICSCSPFFHYNSSAEECQYVETYGQPCRPSSKSDQKLSLSAGRTTSGKRSTRMRGSGNYVISSRHHSSSSSSSYHYRQRRSLGETEVGVVGSAGGSLKRGPPVTCTLPTVCSINGSCVCAEGFEHQPGSTPQCVALGGHFHIGSDRRSGAKNDHIGGPLYERGFEGHSNVGNFVEYVLYVLVPALIVILMFKPCFRRIGEWRTHIHQYNSDSDFYLANTAPAIAGDCNVIAASGEKVPSVGVGGQYSTPFPPFSSHALTGCGHAGPFLFESVDGCVYGGCLSSQLPPQGASASADPSLALVREKLQTIEETQSEDGATSAGGAAGGSACNLSAVANVNALNEVGGCASCLAAMAAGDKQCCSWGHVLIGGGATAGTTCALGGHLTTQSNLAAETGVMMMNGVHRESPQQQHLSSNIEKGPDAVERGVPNGCSAKGVIEKAEGMEMIQFSKDQQQQQQQQECSSSTDRELDHSKKEISEMI